MALPARPSDQAHRDTERSSDHHRHTATQSKSWRGVTPLCPPGIMLVLLPIRLLMALGHFLLLGERKIGTVHLGTQLRGL